MQETRNLAEIEKQLQEPVQHVRPVEWLTRLFSGRHIDEESASEYLAQSPYFKDAKWDLPEEEEDSSDDEKSFGYYDPHSDDEDTSEGYTDEEEQEENLPVDPWQSDNERLQHRFMDMFNDVLDYFGLGSSRRALSTESTDDEYDDIFYRFDDEDTRNPNPPKFSTRPDLLLLGEDARQLPRSLSTYNRGMSVELGDRQDLYRGCVAVGKVQKVGGRRGLDAMLAKVATCAQYVSLLFRSSRLTFI